MAQYRTHKSTPEGKRLTIQRREIRRIKREGPDSPRPRRNR